jgi:cytochrome c oxidase assembly factor CtaG
VNHVVTVLSVWTFDPVPGFALVGAAIAYLWAAHTISQRSPDARWPRRLTASFLSGLTLTWIVILGPVGAYDDTFFWAHMVQHIVLMMLAAPLLLLGAPILLLLRVSSRAFRHRYIVPVLRMRVIAALTHPVVSWVLFAGVLTGTHFSPFFDYSLRHPLVHEYIEHPLYLGVALLFYYPLLGANAAPGRLPPAGRVISLFLMMVPETMTGFFIYASRFLLYPFYATTDRPFGPGPLGDQQMAGSLMWAGGMLIDSVWVSFAVMEWLRSEERRSHRVDLETLAAPTLPLTMPK